MLLRTILFRQTTSGTALTCFTLRAIAFAAVSCLSATAFSQSPTAAPASGPPSTQNALAIPIEQQPFDSAQYLFGNPANIRGDLASHGIMIEPYLFFDNSKVFPRWDQHAQRQFSRPVQSADHR
jgi:hypothetical protein